MNITKEKLIEYIECGRSYEDIGREIGITGSGIRKKAQYWGIKLPSRRKINEKETFNKGKKFSAKKCPVCGELFSGKPSNIYCSMECFYEHERKEKQNRYNEYLKTDGNNVPQKANYSIKWIKPFLLEEQNHRCAICGNIDEWNGKPLIFILDHVDGDAANNKRSNFRLICSNCDSQLDTYKSKNKNGSRSYYRYHKHEGVSHRSSKPALIE